MKHKAIALISGGLDSLLAAKVVQEQGIEVQGICFIMPFASRDIDAFKENVRGASEEAGIQVKMVDISREFLRVLVNPRHGHGSHLNPCIDCKILMLRKTKELMREEGAEFVVTGEVLGERPMSQMRPALDKIRRESNLDGYLLRPLSAKLLEETVPEKENIINREALCDISGRSRARQFELAEKYGITRYFTPAGGCLLTQEGYCSRLEDLMRHGILTMDNINLLRHGRHFRLDDNTKVIVGRDQDDNEGLLSLKGQDDMIFKLKHEAGPVVLLRGDKTKVNIEKAASLCISHSKKKDSGSQVVEYYIDEKKKKEIKAPPMAKDRIEDLRL